MSTFKPLYPHPAAMLSYNKSKYLLIGDLHIGFEQRFVADGIRIEASIAKMLNELFELINDYAPERLIILGDVKFSVDVLSSIEWKFVPEFLEKVSSKMPVTIIPGNHDGGLGPLIPRNVDLVDPYGLLIGDVGVLHGHTAISERLRPARRIVMGHLHPIFGEKGTPLQGRPVWVILRAPKRALFEADQLEGAIEIIVMPSFNRELSAAGFRETHEKTIAPIIRKTRSSVKEAIIMTLEGDIIGDIESLDKVL